MEGTKNKGGGGGEDQDMGEGMQCSDHPYRSNPGGICAFCLQDKLGKLLSSSSSSSAAIGVASFFPAAAAPVAPSSSSSSPPPFRSDPPSLSLSARRHQQYYSSSHSKRARIPFGLMSQKKKKKEKALDHQGGGAAATLKRSKSTATPRRGRFFDDDGFVLGPQKRSGGGGGFWSFLHLGSSKPSASSVKKMIRNPRDSNRNESARSKEDVIVECADESESPNASSSSSFGRKVSRSRSVGCGSRSFSGDFFERISTGFGDCTLRRVESHREGKPKASGAAGDHPHHCMKERVRCGGIFGGFNLTSSSSSSSSSSYWVSTSAEDLNGRSTAAVTPASMANGRSRSWGWALASPMRAFSRPSSKEGKREREASTKNAAPNLAEIPSILAVRS